MKWHNNHPPQVELSNREQRLLGLQSAFPDSEVLSEALFTRRKTEWRAQKAARLAADILAHEMAAKWPESIDAEATTEVSYDMSDLKKPGVIVGDSITDAKFAYSSKEAQLLGLPPHVTKDGKPCSGLIELEHVLPEGAHSFWHYRDTLCQARDVADDTLNRGISTVGGILTGSDAMAQFNADMTVQIDYVERAIDRVRDWRETHDL
jgi:hypothetical protein